MHGKHAPHAALALTGAGEPIRFACMPARSLFAAAAVLALLAGCGVPPPASQFPTGQAAIDRMKATYACVEGVRGAGKIDVFASQGRIRGDLYLLAVNPDRVRFDIVSPFGPTLYTLTSDGQRFQLLDVKEKQFSYGPATACNLARLTQVPVPGHVLVTLLRGEAPILVHAPEHVTLAWDGAGFYRVVVPSKHNATEELHLEVHPDDFDKAWGEQRVRVRDVRVVQRGVELYHAELEHHEPAATSPPRVDEDGIEPPIPPIGRPCNAELPRSIRMRVPNTRHDVLFQYREAAWNPPILPGTFTQRPPGGVRAHYVTCSDR